MQLLKLPVAFSRGGVHRKMDSAISDPCDIGCGSQVGPSTCAMSKHDAMENILRWQGCDFHDMTDLFAIVRDHGQMRANIHP